jgi:hypothetical protein
MKRVLSPRSTFKPQLESLEARDLPSGAGVALYMELQNIQQGVQAMQTQANAASNTFVQLGIDDHAWILSNYEDFTPLEGLFTDNTKIGGEIQSVRFLNTQIQAQLQVFQLAVVGVASDGDPGDQALALFAYLQVNGGLGGLFGGSSSGLASQAQSALNQVNQIASATQTPSGDALHMTIDQRLNS